MLIQKNLSHGKALSDILQVFIWDHDTLEVVICTMHNSFSHIFSGFQSLLHYELCDGDGAEGQAAYKTEGV